LAALILEVDPILPNEKFQAGGCLIMVQGKWATTIHRETIQDKTGLGRWSGLSVTGKQNRTISIIVGYRVCKGSIQSSGLGTAYHREYEYYADRNKKSPNPRKEFLLDLESTIQALRDKGHAIIVMLDANETIKEGNDLSKWIDRLDLQDLHKQDPAPSTYIGSASRRIDFMFGCPKAALHTKASGTLSYLDGPQSDHRGMFIDIDIGEYIQYDASKNPIVSPSARILRTGNPELVARYHQEIHRYYEDHNMEQRIESLYKNFTNMSQADIRSKLEAWDRDQGRAMLHAESELAIPSRNYAWSPELRNAAIIRRYWRLRLKEATDLTSDYTSTIARLQMNVQQHDPTFRLPHHGQQLTPPEVRKHLNTASRTLKTAQMKAIENRFKTNQDLLAMYQNDQDPETRPESTRKAKIVKRTIRTEKIRNMFSNIRNTVKGILPQQQTGINQLKIPIMPTTGNSREMEHTAADFQEYIAQANPHDIVWDTILDQEAIEKHLRCYNRKSFRAAATSPCGHGIIYDALSFTSLTEPGRRFLEGQIPQSWYGDDKLLHEFLISFMIPQHIRNRPPIKTTMSEEDIRRGISKWKEKTSTSPSGRHLGHYRAIIQDPRLLKCMTQFMHIAIKSGIAVSRWSQATNVMLEKDIGNPCIHRLRIIHLFEADFNLYMKLQWGKRLVRRANKHMLLNTGQLGPSQDTHHWNQSCSHSSQMTIAEY
jgi:hypothetical protein